MVCLHSMGGTARHPFGHAWLLDWAFGEHLRVCLTVASSRAIDQAESCILDIPETFWCSEVYIPYLLIVRAMHSCKPPPLCICEHVCRSEANVKRLCICEHVCRGQRQAIVRM